MERIIEGCVRLFYTKMRVRMYTEVVLTTVIGMAFAAYAVKNLLNTEYTTEQFCQLNSVKKTEPDVVLENITNSCQSELVLDFTPDELEPWLQATLYMQAITCSCLAAAGVVSLVGIRRTRGLLMRPWLGFNTCWIISLVITMAILLVWGFVQYSLVLLGVLLLNILFLLDVSYFTWRIPRQGNYTLKDGPEFTRNFGDGEVPVEPTSGAT